ncbi:MAG: protein-L-isoaspartate(D-aspartate) O-methyltransferase [Proteobacteria bacterium]|nr:protein-L-isoaspartate(D-aspartate) O-methyltransferase [Pseudomonadota bacterium]
MVSRTEAESRERLIEAIRRDFRATAFSTGCADLDAQVESALRRVPREAFVAEFDREFAYDNRPLAIGHGQTISQPFIVALMTQLAKLDRRSVVLEIGTGSGYQAAVLSCLAAQVYSIEIVEPLALQAAARLARLGYTNVSVRAADGQQGWAEHAPYDAIVVTAGGAVPPALYEQLAEGGRMVMPVELRADEQQLRVIDRMADGEFESRDVLAVRFVPLTGHTPGNG